MTPRSVSPLIGRWLLTFFVTCLPVTSGNHDAKRLFDVLMYKHKYNKIVRPVDDHEFAVKVKLGIKLTQVIDVDEKNQMLTLSMYLIHKWIDESLQWNPEEFGNVQSIYVPSELIWIPDVVLYNTADGDYTVTIMTKAELSYTGELSWQPPVIFKPQCEMNMQYFPFDEQMCKMKFGAWSHDRGVVDLQHVWMEKYNIKNETDVIKDGIDLAEYHPSAEWEIMDVPAKKNIIYYPCCPNDSYPDVTFNITLRRKTLYFTYNLIIPCISINMLTILTFYLPSDSGEKISLCVSILLSLSIFQLLLIELIPATSLTTPLVAKYILFTMVVVSLSVFISVITLNVHFRSSATHEMPELSKKIFLQILPKLLLMRPPRSRYQPTDEGERPDFPADISTDCTWGNPYRGRLKLDDLGQETDIESILPHYSVTSSFIGSQLTRFAIANMGDICYACAKRKMSSYPPSAIKALESCVFLAKHIQDEKDGNKIKEDWKYLALVMDRLFLYIFLSMMTITAMAILLNAPTLHDRRTPIELNHIFSRISQKIQSFN